jgi:CDP-2,3-bis-(O-geranylgeranyl)-sn-glycerol synthase
MFSIIIQAFWLFLPAAFANMIPTLSKKIPFLNFPLDFNKKFKGKPILGKNKTFRGLFFAIIVSILAVYIQSFIYPTTPLIDYTQANLPLLGFLLSFGAIFGDALESFFKRQANIKPGKPWIGFDQIDWIIGSAVFLNLSFPIPLETSLVAIVLFALLHPITNLTGYLLGTQKNKF